MYTGINFLKERNRMQELILIRDKKIAQITSIALGVFLFVMVALLAFQLFLGARLSAVQAETDGAQRSLIAQQPLQAEYVGVYNKVKTVQDILTKRGNKWDAITFFYSLLPVGVSINSVDLETTGSSSQLSFSLQAPTIFLYDQLSSVLQSDKVKQSGYTLGLGSLSRSKDGAYRLEVTLSNAAPAAPKPAPRATPAANP